jgi:hypothetical protein
VSLDYEGRLALERDLMPFLGKGRLPQGARRHLEYKHGVSFTTVHNTRKRMEAEGLTPELPGAVLTEDQVRRIVRDEVERIRKEQDMPITRGRR